MRPESNDLAPVTVVMMQTELVRPDVANPRKHPKKQVDKLVAAYNEFGYLSPLLVSEDGTVIGGHLRLKTAQRLGLARVPVIVMKGLSLAQKRALQLFDNRVSEEGVWDEDLLVSSLSSIVAAGYDVTQSGFDDIELDRLLTSPFSASPEVDDEVPAVPKSPVSRMGDLWACGDHLIFCGDAREPTSYEAVLRGQLADMLFTDVPYNLKVPGMVSGLGRTKHADFAMASGEMSDAEFLDFLTTVMRNGRDFSKDGSLHYHCIDWRHIADVVTAGKGLFSGLLNVCVWAKPNAGMGSFYRSQHEMVALFKHGVASHTNNIQLGRLGRSRSNLWQYDGASSFSSTRRQDLEDHPTVKPVALVTDAIRDASIPGDLVLDPFGGSGTTMLAAQASKRRSALIEIAPAYVDVTLRRFFANTKIEPVLLPDSTPLSLVKDQRRETSDER